MNVGKGTAINLVELSLFFLACGGDKEIWGGKRVLGKRV